MDAFAQAGSSGDARLYTLKEYLSLDLEHMRKRQQTITDLLVAPQPEANHGRPKQAFSTLAETLVPQPPPQRPQDVASASIKVTDIFDELFNELDKLQADAQALAIQYRDAVASIRRSGQCMPIQVDRHFPRFMDLPAELRVKIWKYSLHICVVNLVQPHNIHRDLPAIAHTCAESREIFLQLCSVSKTSRDKKSSVSYPGLPDIDSSRVRHYSHSIGAAYLPDMVLATTRTYPSYDWARKTTELIIQVPWEPSQALKITQPSESRNLYGYGPNGNFRPVIPRGMPSQWISRHFFQLRPEAYIDKTVSILAGPSCYIQRSWGRPDLVHDLFQGRRILIVDLQDSKEVARVARIMRQFRQHWAATGDTKNLSHVDIENRHILAIDNGEADWNRWNTVVVQSMMNDLAVHVVSNWIPLSDHVRESTSNAHARMTAGARHAAMAVLSRTRLRLVHVLEAEGPYSRVVTGPLGGRPNRHRQIVRV